MILEKKSLPPPPPLPSFPPKMEVPKAPPLLSSPIMNREGVVSPPKASCFIALVKSPLAPKEKPNIKKTAKATLGEISRGNVANQTRLKPLYWDKVVKSTDGKTNLLNFIVEQVAQFEGRQQAINQKHNLHGSIGETSNTTEPHSDNVIQKEAFKEYLMLGFQVLGGPRDELCQVKKAASIEYQNLISMFSTLNAYVTEIRQIITSCGNSERGGFVKVTKGFKEECHVELKVVREEQTRVIELVKKTNGNEYYLTGCSKDNTSNPFQLFVTVKEFLNMVDEVCIELRRKVENNNIGGEAASTSPLSPSKRAPLRFPNFELHFLQSMTIATSSSQLSDGDL